VLLTSLPATPPRLIDLHQNTRYDRKQRERPHYGTAPHAKTPRSMRPVSRPEEIVFEAVARLLRIEQSCLTNSSANCLSLPESLRVIDRSAFVGTAVNTTQIVDKIHKIVTITVRPEQSFCERSDRLVSSGRFQSTDFRKWKT